MTAPREEAPPTPAHREREAAPPRPPGGFAPRRATLADLGTIMALERASFPTDAWSEASMRAELESPHNVYLVLEEAGRVLGYAGLRAPAGARDGDVQTIAVSQASRARGRGRMLLTALLEEARARGIHEMFLDVREDNPVARALYASEGFVDIGRRPRYYQPDDVDAVVMRLDLDAWAAARAAASSEEIRHTEDAPGETSPPLGGSPPLRAALASDAGWCT